MTLSLNMQGTILTFTPEIVVIAGFTGRNQQDVADHLTELEELGIPVPDTVPSFYHVPADLLVQDDTVTAAHEDTSGEAEVVLVVNDGDVIVTLGSDHTDRRAERSDIGISKGLCRKPISDEAWSLDAVIDHTDQLEMRSWIRDRGNEVLYQSGQLVEILPITEVLAQVTFVDAPRSFALFTGTVPAIGGIRASSSFRAELFDPIHNRSLTLEYRIDVQTSLGRAPTPTPAHERGSGLP